MNPDEQLLLQAIAHDPESVMRELVSPTVDIGEGWLPHPLTKKIVLHLASQVLGDRPIGGLVNIITALRLGPSDSDMLLAMWQQGKAEQVEWRPVIERLKATYMSRQADEAIASYRHSVQQAPLSIRQYLAVLGHSVSSLASYGEIYDPTPSAHLKDIGIEITPRRWGDAVLDDMFDGGIPSHGKALWVAPTGFGKSTAMRTLVARLICQGIDIVAMTNEATAGDYAKSLMMALSFMWANTKEHDEIIQLMDYHLRLYDDVNEFEAVDRILFYNRPPVAIIDSLDNLSFPKYADKYKDPNDRHQARANGLRNMAIRYNTLINVPGNGSGAMQAALREGIDKVDSVKGFGSSWYENVCDWSFALTRNRHIKYQSDVKRVKDRKSGRIGIVWHLNYDPIAHCYFGA